MSPDPSAELRASQPRSAPVPASPLHRDGIHDSAWRHVTGAARYVDDLMMPRRTLHAAIVGAPVAAGTLEGIDAAAALAAPGVVAVLTAADIPGENRIGPIVHDEPILAEDAISFHGQPVAAVIAETFEAARAAARLVEVRATATEPILGIPAAIAVGSVSTQPHIIARGDLEAAFAQAHLIIEAEVATPGQNHFYLETQACLAEPGEDDTWHIISSTQHPTEVQKMAAAMLGLGQHKVVCEVLRMGGGFGGKESQAAGFACIAALGALKTGRPVALRLKREEDMILTGNRHPFWSKARAAFTEEGRILGFEVDIYSDGGWSVDLSGPVMDRALFHLDNAYYIPALRFRGQVCRTNVASNTAFRGFGGPQGAYVIEEVLSRAAERLGVDATALRRLNYYGEAPRDECPYGQRLEDNHCHRAHDEVLASSDYAARRAAIEAFNASSRWLRRGISLQPVKFGISFTKGFLNQAGALVLVYADGTVQLNHGGTEMGQGLHAKMLAICAHELGVELSAVRMMNTATDKVPNSSATAASSGSDLNGQAVRIACETVRERMRPIAATMLDCAPEAVTFAGGFVYAGEKRVPFAELATRCWLEQVSLASTGFYRTPGIHYDEAAGRGRPFFYYTYGAAVIEVEVSALTGEHRVLRADILNDAGRSLIPSIDKGQVEGGFIQSLGWLTCEEMLWREDGRVQTVGPSTYKIPAVGEAPLELRVALLDRSSDPKVIHGSKAVGEPPFLYGIGVITALRHAIASFGEAGKEVELKLPATPEAILRAVVAQRGA